jgi:hypothetical protein
MTARGSSASFNGRSGADAAGGASAGVAGLTAGAGLVSMVGALDVGEALTGARSGAGGTATVGAGLTTGASGFGEGVSASAGSGFGFGVSMTRGASSTMGEAFVRSAAGSATGRIRLRRVFNAGDSTSKTRSTLISPVRINHWLSRTFCRRVNSRMRLSSPSSVALRARRSIGDAAGMLCSAG